MAGENTLNPTVKYWRDQIQAAQKREKDWRKDGRKVVELYEAQKKEDNSFNILYSNTETLLPALYNNTPRPVVERRFKDKDPLGKLAAKVGERLLSFLIDSNDQGYSNFDDMAKQSVLEALLPGRGVLRFKYDATIVKVPKAAPEVEEEAAEPVDSPQEEAAEQERVTSEAVCGEEVPWDRVLFGYAKKWKDVPWVAFEHFFNKEELQDNFGTRGALIPLSTASNGDEDGEEKAQRGEEADGEKLSHVFEIWDKRSKKVIFIADGFAEVVKEVEDPLKLSGFLPMPKPLAFVAKVSGLTPTPLYKMYEEQARELNAITLRINKIVRALKVRGFYDSTLEGIDDLLDSEDNTLLPAQNVSAMLQGQTLEKAIWLMPIEKLINVLQQLYVQRGQVKDVIYEITGISDILRGSSQASETATAQNIKNQWGTLRLKRGQKEVQRYVRDCFRIMLEIAVTKLSVDQIAKMTGIELPYAAQKQQAMMVMQQLQQAQQQVPPDLSQMLSSPTWEDVMALLQDDLQRNYRIDVETNSTVDVEATEDKEQIGEFMNAMAQFMNGIMPAIESGYMTIEAAKAMLLTISRRFRFGTEVEDQIAAIEAPKTQGEDPAKQAEAQKAQIELQTLQEKAKIDQQTAQMKLEIEQQKLELEKEKIALERQKLMQQREFSEAQHGQKMQQMMQSSMAADAAHRQQMQQTQEMAAMKGE